MKPKAKTTEERVHQILGKQMRYTFEDAAAYLPLIATTRQNTRKAQKDNDIPQIPVNREDNPVLPKGYHLTKHGEPFLTFDSVKGSTKNISLVSAHTFSFKNIPCIHCNVEKFSRVITTK